MDTNELINEEFLEKFKTREEFDTFFSSLYKRGVETMLKGELEAHLGYKKNELRTDKTNARNGYNSKKLKSEHGEVKINVPRDRTGDFEPQLVPKRSGITQGIENLVVSLYAKGMSNSDIEDELHEIYGFNLSTSTISLVTDKITSDIVAWQNRPLETIYLVVWMDTIVFKVRDNSRVINKAIYLAVGLAPFRANISGLL